MLMTMIIMMLMTMIIIMLMTMIIMMLREGSNVLCNDSFNRFYLRLYGVGHIVKDHIKEETRCLHRPVFPTGAIPQRE